MKNVVFYKLYITLFCFIVSFSLLAQPTNSIVKDVVQAAPNVGSLGKYGDIPVSLYTGTPSISIPIQTISEGPLSLPVRLDYHASGVRVAETASWVGIGWSLQAGGMITRTTQGVDDDDLVRKGFFHTGASDLNIGLSTVSSYLDGNSDAEPDIFTFNFAGYSGKFFFDANKDYHFVPKQDLKLETNLDNGSPSAFNQFTIITPDGTKYYFGKDPIDNQEALEFSASTGESTGKATASSWYLVRIESHDKKYFIKLAYEQEGYSYVNLASRRYLNVAFEGTTCDGYSLGIEQSSLPNFDQYHHYIKTNIQGKRLSQITCSSSTMQMDFIPSATNREDLSTHANLASSYKELDEIVITTGDYCSKFKLNHDYYHDKFHSSFANQPFAKRLKLLSVQEVDCSTASVPLKPAYLLEYDDITRNNASFLPHRLNKGTDHWGFYNGGDKTNTLNENNNEVKIVNVPLTTLAVNGTTISYGTAYRDVDFDYAKLGILKKITYPTGGHTQFTFESNKHLGKTSSGSPIPRLDLNNTDCYQNIATCCGTTLLSDNDQFLSVDEIDEMFFRMYLGNVGCSVPNKVRVDAYRTTDNFHIGGMEAGLDDNWYKLTSIQQNGVFMPNVQYTFKVQVQNGNGGFKLEQRPSTSGSVSVGGLRIKEIRTHDGLDSDRDIIKTYTYLTENGLESGELFREPNYGLVLQNYSSLCAADNGNSYNPVLFDGGIFFDQSYVPLGNFEGRSVAYNRVIESFNGNGSRIHKFHVLTGTVIPSYPVTPDKLNTHNGQPIYMQQRDEQGDLLAATITTQHENRLVSSIPQTLYKLTIPISLSGISRAFLYTPYQMQTSIYRVHAVEEIIDDVSTITSYQYDEDNPETGYPFKYPYDYNRHYFPTRTTVTNSDGKTHTTESKYIFDAVNEPVYATMKSRNMIATPIEVKQFVNTVQTNGTQTVYNFFQSNGYPGGTGTATVPIYPQKYLNYEMTWAASGTPQVTGSDSGWELQGEILEYDLAAGKPKRFKQRGWEEETYTWNADNQLIDSREYEDFIWQYKYHPNTRLLSEIIDIDKQDTDFEYDDLRRLTSITERDGKVITSYDYKYHGQDVARPQNYIKVQKTLSTLVVGSSLKNLISYQYLDGIGRTIQTVQQQHAPDIVNPTDIITAITYDNQGRPIHQYEPYLSTNINGGFVDLSTIEQANTKFTESVYEFSPLNRIKKVIPPEWFPTHTLYGHNTTRITIPSTAISFAANELRTQTVIEPDGSGTFNGDRRITFTDKLGRVVLSKAEKEDGTLSTNTFMIYDDKNRVSKILPPDVTTATAYADLYYEYRYDGRDRVTYKKIPDQKHISYDYNFRDLLVSRTDGNLRAGSKRMVTKYDPYGRPIETGLTSVSYALNLDLPHIQELWTATAYDGNGLDGNPTIHSDEYIGKIRESKAALLNGNTAQNHFINTKYEYDSYGRITKQEGQHHKHSPQSTIFKHSYDYLYDWADNLTKETFSHAYNESNNETSIIKRYYYDHQGRLKNTQHKYGTFSNQHTSSLTYTPKDQLAKKYLGGNSSTALQKTDYSYLENGFLKAINEGLGNDPTDLFRLVLNYNQGNTTLAAAAQYNGNISQINWQVGSAKEQTYGYEYDYLDRLTQANYGVYGSAARSSLSPNQHYQTTYEYDARGNITNLTRNGVYFDGTSWQHQEIDNLDFTPKANSNQIASITDAAPCPTNTYIGETKDNTHLHAVGEILVADNLVNETATVVYQAGDCITLEAGFHAKAGTNFLAKIEDCPTDGYESGGFVQRGSGTLHYDANGNMDIDPNKGMAISYNYHNLPYQITFDNGNTLEWLYDAGGTKWQKTVTANNQSIPLVQQDYFGSVEYNNGDIEGVYFEDGRLGLENGIAEYQYYLKDHLGNNRVVFKDNGTGVAEVIQTNHYYPFGLQMEGAWNQNDTPENNYLYNGKELDTDFGLNTYDYITRTYDPAIGRFWQIDGLADNFSSWSPFSYGFNNPVRFIDPDGQAPNDIILGNKDQGTQHEVLSQLRQLTNDELNIQRGKVVITSRGTANKDKDLSGGTKLIADLIGHDGTTTIKIDKDRGNQTFPVNKGTNREITSGKAEESKEYNSNVYIKGTDPTTVNADGSRGVEGGSFITLGHELQHAREQVTGQISNTVLSAAYDFDTERVFTNKSKRPFTVREYRTRQFENILRKEQGISPRALPITPVVLRAISKF